MKNLLYGIAVIMVLCWAIGFFVYALGSMIHLLLLLAVVAFLVRFTQRNENK